MAAMLEARRRRAIFEFCSVMSDRRHYTLIPSLRLRLRLLLLHLLLLLLLLLLFIIMLSPVHPVFLSSSPTVEILAHNFLLLLTVLFVCLFYTELKMMQCTLSFKEHLFLRVVVGSA